MTSNPFFSGRIPQTLYDKAEEYCKQTNKKKTELLIDALSQFLNFSSGDKTTEFTFQSVEVTKEMFEALEKRVQAVENLMITNVIINDNQYNDATILTDNSLYQSDNITDKNFAKVEVAVIENDNDNSLEKKKDADDKVEIIINDNNTDNKEENVSAIIINDNNIDNQGKNESVLDFNEITDSKLTELTGRTKKQISGLKGSRIRQLKKEGIEVTPGLKLEKPILIETKEPIIIKDNFYTIYFLGTNLEGEWLWKLVRNDNKSYQHEIISLTPRIL